MEEVINIQKNVDGWINESKGYVYLKIEPLVQPSPQTTITMFSNTTALSALFVTTMGGSVTYNQFVQSITGNPLVFESVNVYSYASNYNQIVRQINCNLLQADGVSFTYNKYPVINPFQYQAAITNIDLENFIANGVNNLTYTMLINQTVVFLFKVKNLDFEDYINNAKCISEKIIENKNS